MDFNYFYRLANTVSLVRVTRYTMREGNMNKNQQKQKAAERATGVIRYLELSDVAFKIIIECTDKNDMENFSRELEITNKNQMQILELKR